jgi:hypothetical protein
MFGTEGGRLGQTNAARARGEAEAVVRLVTAGVAALQTPESFASADAGACASDK